MRISTKTDDIQSREDYPTQVSDREPVPKRFVQLVKDTFHDRPKIYKKFVHILSQVQYADADKLDLIKRVITLFDGYPHLIMGFNAFIPGDYSIEIQEDAVVIKVLESVGNLSHIDTGHFRKYERQDLVSTLDAGLDVAGASDDTIEYIQRVKEMYADEPVRYNKFKEVLKELHSKKVDEIETIHRIVRLFHKYPHLIVGFNRYLPKGYHIEMHSESYDVEYPGHRQGEITVVNFKKKYY